MAESLRTGRPFWYITNAKVSSAFHPFGVGKSNNLSGLGYGGAHSPVSGGR